MSSGGPGGRSTDILGPPVVHAAWSDDWWGGDPGLAELFGPAPTLGALAACAERIDAARATRPIAPPAPIPSDALVVLAGQQPVLAAGPALVAHKAATAIRLAADLERAWGRRVVPVFLLADEDHDSAEVDHVDVIKPSNGNLMRIRCHVLPGSDAFHRSRWDASCLDRSLASVAGTMAAWTRGGEVPGDQASLRALSAALLESAPPARFAGQFTQHVATLIAATFGSAGLVCLPAHELTARAPEVLDAALARHADARAVLADGARRLVARHLRVPFDPGDTRPLVLRSDKGRRRRLDPPGSADPELVAARRLLGDDPASHSPNAALRPIIQAATLPVVAQVVGPSELLYLGQARGLNGLFGQVAPLLVPRLEATHVPARWPGIGPARDQLEAVRGIVFGSGKKNNLWEEEAEVLAAARRLAARTSAADPSLARRAERWLAALERSTRRLAESPLWRGRLSPDATTVLRPRGRPQDAVLAWLPLALASGDPVAWGRALVERAAPCDAPRHHLCLPGWVGAVPTG